MLRRQLKGIDQTQKTSKYKEGKSIREEKRAILRLVGEGVTKVELTKQLGVGQAGLPRTSPLPYLSP